VNANTHPNTMIHRTIIASSSRLNHSAINIAWSTPLRELSVLRQARPES
jgi:hypothetical protein